MKKKSQLWFNATCLFFTSAIFFMGYPLYAESHHDMVNKGCFPDNNLNLLDNIYSLESNLDEEQFRSIISKVQSFYEPIVSTHQANLFIRGDWSDSTVNAYAKQSGSQWEVAMFGGLARQPEVTPDGFAMVVCHEVGHHLAGFPFKGSRWAASEGQSDYFATQACALNLWSDDLEVNSTFRESVDPFAKEKCDQVFQDQNRQNICYRTAMAGQSLANLLAKLRRKPIPDFSTPDPTIETKTDESHPGSQCRLDTYFNGALCDKKFNDLLIPGKAHQDGQGSLAAEAIAAKLSCSAAELYPNGKRPRCWYAAKLALIVEKEKLMLSEITGNGNQIWEPGEVFGLNIPLTNNLLVPVNDISLSVDYRNENMDSVKYPKISQGETKSALSPFPVQAPDNAHCGDTFDVVASFQTDGWESQSDFHFLLGKRKTVEKLKKTVGTEIPDSSATGVTGQEGGAPKKPKPSSEE
jgi:hypothetical protein